MEGIDKSDGKTREEHLLMCKQRALEYIEHGLVDEAMASFSNDMNQHPGTNNNIAILLGVMLWMNGKLATQESMKKFIEGFT